MRGTHDSGLIKTEGYVKNHIAGGYQAVLRIAHHGTFYGEEVRATKEAAQEDLNGLLRKHLPKPNNDGVSTQQNFAIQGALAGLAYPTEVPA